MADTSLISFEINRMDGLGQGVCKNSDKITFIKKVLPGESGEARIVGEKKGVRFASLIKINLPSPDRIQPLCPHFNQCPSCHYLHTSYEQELSFKLNSLEHLLRKIPHPKITVTPAIRRNHYRNRIQLHYDKSKRLLGMLDLNNHTIIPIPQCQITRPQIADQLTRLYLQDEWLKLVHNEPPRGHLEIYELNGNVKIKANRPYADGGFTQVFEEMNQILIEKLTCWANQDLLEGVLDLFAGNGNLTNYLNYSKRLCADFYSVPMPEGFLSLDLYHSSAISKVREKWASANTPVSLLVVDPPRSGIKNFQAWLQEFSPLRAIYVSCDPQTLIRDITGLMNYHIEEVHLIDFFPSTYHFETMIFLTRK
jgi:23S rRNA (uracil1939-C5)-methyltransferase